MSNSQWRSSTAIVAVDVASGSTWRLSPDDGAAWSLLDHRNGDVDCAIPVHILVSRVRRLCGALRLLLNGFVDPLWPEDPGSILQSISA